MLGVRNALATLRDGLPDGGEDFKRLEPTHRRSEWGSAAAVAGIRAIEGGVDGRDDSGGGGRGENYHSIPTGRRSCHVKPSFLT